MGPLGAVLLGGFSFIMAFNPTDYKYTYISKCFFKEDMKISQELAKIASPPAGPAPMLEVNDAYLVYGATVIDDLSPQSNPFIIVRQSDYLDAQKAVRQKALQDGREEAIRKINNVADPIERLDNIVKAWVSK